jgi:hypothetical protein
LQFSWLAFTDPTVIAVEVEYRKVGETDSIFKVATVPQQILRTADGVLSDTDMEYRHRLITSPLRTTFPTDWATVHTDTASAPTVAITLDSLQPDIYDLLRDMNTRLRDLDDLAQQVAAAAGEATGENVNRHTIAKRFQDATAVVITEQNAAIEVMQGVVTASAEAVQLVAAQIGPTGAEGLFRIRAESTSSGAQATVGISVSATEGGVTQQAAILLDAMSGGESRVILKGDKVLIMDDGGSVQAMFDSTGTYIRNAFIDGLTADNITAHSITGDEIAFDTLIGDHIVALSIDSPSLAFEAVTEFEDISYSNSASGGSGGSNTGGQVLGASVIVSNPAATPIVEFISLSVSCGHSGAGGDNAGIRILRDGVVILTVIKTSNGGAPVTGSQTTFLNTGATSYDYDIEYSIAMAGASGWSWSVESASGALFWKR